MRQFSRLYGVVWLVIFLLSGVGLLAAQQPVTSVALQATPTPEVLIMTPIVVVTAEVTLETTPEATATVAATVSASPTATRLEDESYTVVRGDRLIKIADRYGVALSCLVRVNRIANPNLIYIGQTLLIPATCQGQGGGEILATAVPGTGATVTGAGIVGGGQCQFDRYPGRVAPGGVYTIRAGDTLDYIACDFGIALTCLLESNPTISENRGEIHAGDPVTINLACPAWEGPNIP